MPSASRFTTIDFISKVTDFTNIGPEFLIAVALLVFWHPLTGIPLLPILLHSAIQSRLAEMEKAVAHLEEQIPEGRKQRTQWRGEAAALDASTKRKGQESCIAGRREDFTQKIGSSEQHKRELRTSLKKHTPLESRERRGRCLVQVRKKFLRRSWHKRA